MTRPVNDHAAGYERERQSVSQTFTIEKRGRMLRRARKFGRPETYDRTLHLSVPCWRGGPDAALELTMRFDPVRQTVRPVVAVNGVAAALSTVRLTS